MVDDAQWADPSSAALVGHLARHGVADRLAVLVAIRTAVQPIDLASTASPAGADIDDRRTNNYGGITTIELQPLTHAATLSALLAAGFSHDEAQGWALRCGGLPLAISEVARRGAFAPPDPREVAAFLPAAYLQSIASLPAKVADAALCVAICSDLRVLRSLGLPRFTDHLRALEKAGVTLPVPAPTLEPRVVFRHPLLHAAVLASAHRDRERAIHRMVATALTEHGLADRAALHLASAADGPDEAAADAMSAFAQRARARGALA